MQTAHAFARRSALMHLGTLGGHVRARRQADAYENAYASAYQQETVTEDGNSQKVESGNEGDVAGAAGSAKSVDENVPPLVCVQKCVDTFKVGLQKVAGADLQSFQNGVFSDKAFENDNFFDHFCGDFTIAEECIEACGEVESAVDIKESLGPLTFVCKDNYDEFVRLSPCFRDAFAKSKVKCEPQCGGQDFLKEKLSSLGSINEGEPDVEKLFKVMGDMCGFVECQLTCQTPILNEVCESERPAGLMREFVQQAIGATVDKLDKVGLGELFPAECRKLAGKEDLGGEVKAALEFGPAGQGGGCDSALFELKKSVLEKELEKLDWEIKQIKAEMGVES